MRKMKRMASLSACETSDERAAKVRFEFLFTCSLGMSGLGKSCRDAAGHAVQLPGNNCGCRCISIRRVCPHFPSLVSARRTAGSHLGLAARAESPLPPFRRGFLARAAKVRIPPFMTDAVRFFNAQFGLTTDLRRRGSTNLKRALKAATCNAQVFPFLQQASLLSRPSTAGSGRKANWAE